MFCSDATCDCCEDVIQPYWCLVAECSVFIRSLHFWKLPRSTAVFASFVVVALMRRPSMRFVEIHMGSSHCFLFW